MRFLVDNALSPLVAAELQNAGHDAVHIRAYGMQMDSDTLVLARAAAEDRTLLTADTDFGGLLAASNDPKPSVVIFRKGTDRQPRLQVQLLLANLPQLEQQFHDGSVVIIEEARIRIRSLPLHKREEST